MEIDELNQQVAHLKEENEKFQSLITGASSNEEFYSVPELHPENHLQSRVEELELELECTRKQYEEKLKELKIQLLSVKQVKL